MVRLTKIYTKTGDDGNTSIANNLRVSKLSPLIEAIGAVDEANSAIGMTDRTDIIDRIQQDLFDLGAELAGSETIKIHPERVEWLETVIDDYNEYLEPLTSFILPTGPLHNARAVVRRAERRVWMAIEIHENNDDMKFSRDIPKYLNRLSDLLFVMARYYNMEKLWNIKGSKSEAKSDNP
jgi:cob(I)alamin adenosyltransferase